MHWLDWIILAGFLGFTIWDGLRHRDKEDDLETLLLARRSMPWWAAGLSVMATHASAVTFIGTTGLAFMYDMRFLQVYLGLPVATVILAVTLIPLYYKLKVYTIYQALEDRFGLRLRLITSFLFLVSRGATLGFSIAAPAYVLSLIFALPLSTTILFMGATATVYTMFGGITGVIRTDMKQMVLMLGALLFCSLWLAFNLPDGVSWADGLYLAGKLGKLETIDLSFDISEKYNLWSGMIAGMFLMLSYFGADQSQVQRVLTAKSLTDARGSLMMSAIFKVPMQFFILLLGVSLYVFYLFEPRPLLFIPDKDQKLIQEERDAFNKANHSRKEAAFTCLEGDCKEFVHYDEEIKKVRKKAIWHLEMTSGIHREDTNYVFPFFILTQLSPGIIGLIVAAILAAALSSIDSVLNSLAASTVVDWLKRLQRQEKDDDYYFQATRLATAGWGMVATISALLFGETESIIELVNRLGSFFYGPILGVFILLWLPKADQNSVLIGFAFGFLIVFFLGGWYQHAVDGHFRWIFPFYPHSEDFKAVIEYLWLNPVGVFAVVGVGYGLGRGKPETK